MIGKLETLIGASPGEVALTANTSRGVSDVALCLPWNKGDRILCFRGEFPTNVTPWQRAAELYELEVEMIDADAFRTEPDKAWEALDGALARGVRLVAVSAVQFSTGFVMPLEEIARRSKQTGAELFVDAIQACGIVPIDVAKMGIDYLACGSHKWLMGMEGIGFVYARADLAAALRPRVAAWLSHEDPVSFLLEGAGHLRYDRAIRSSIDFVQGGAQNAVGAAALEASLDLIVQLGPKNILAHVNELLDQVEPTLIELGFQSVRVAEGARSGILSAKPPPGVDLKELYAEVMGLGVSVAMPDGFIRVAPHWPNAIDEAEQITLTFDEAVKRVRR